MMEIKKNMNDGKLKSRGQLFSADMLMAIMLFVIILISVIWLKDFLNEKIIYDENRRKMDVIANYAASSLVETPGSPSDWEGLASGYFNEGNISSLGLAQSGSGGWELSPTKVEMLATLNTTVYESIKTMLGLRGSGYEYLLVVSPPGYAEQRIGKEPAANSSNIIVVNRYALYNGSYANVSLYLWEVCTRGCT